MSSFVIFILYCVIVTVQTGSKLEAFFAAFSRKTRVQRRAVHAKRIGITARKRYMSTPFEGAWTVTASILAEWPNLTYSWKVNRIITIFLCRKVCMFYLCSEEPYTHLNAWRLNAVRHSLSPLVWLPASVFQYVLIVLAFSAPHWSRTRKYHLIQPYTRD